MIKDCRGFFLGEEKKFHKKGNFADLSDSMGDLSLDESQVVGAEGSDHVGPGSSTDSWDSHGILQIFDCDQSFLRGDHSQCLSSLLPWGVDGSECRTPTRWVPT